MATYLSRCVALFSLSLVACSHTGEPAPPAPARRSPEATAAPGASGFALVELFSSEGCSSCPPADRLLAELVNEGDDRVLPLSFQVDYWDSLGWADPYGSSTYTARQQAYALELRGQGLYTPQAVVNGREGFVGSDRRKLRAALERELARPAQVHVELATPRRDGGRWQVAYQLQGVLPEGAKLFLAAVQRGAESDVKRGENAGEKLRHEAVVRALESQKAQPQGEAAVPFQREASWVYAWVQQPGREVLGATRVNVP